MIKQIYKRTVIVHCARKSVVAKKKKHFSRKLDRSNRSSNYSSQWKSDTYIFVRGSRVYEIMEYCITSGSSIIDIKIGIACFDLSSGDKRANEMLI